MENSKEANEIEEERAHGEQEKRQVEEDQHGKNKGLNAKKISWRKLVKFDSFDMEAGRISANNNNRSRKAVDGVTILKLAFQSIGVVYGDIGTSPLYVLPGIFPNGISHNDDILGVLALILYSITLITLIKYVFIVLSANDNGEGGTFALYSLICRYAKVSFTPNQQAEDREISNYKIDVPNHRLQRASIVKSMLENSQIAKYTLLFTTMLGTSMVIGDGILTPCISVLSAVGGIREAASSLTDNTIMWTSVVILIILFQIQRFGTDKVGYSFAPILTIWFLVIGIIGLHNFVKYDPGVIRAVNPLYIVQYFKRNKKNAWISLGGVILCLTEPVYWPMFVVAVMAAIIASQSLISASFSIVQQCLALGCFPRVKVVHTSSKYEGQVYVPEINTLLMLACVGVTLGFKNTLQMSNAYGVAVIFVFVLTSSFLVLVMIMIWKTNIFLIILYVLTIGLIELLFLSSVLYKFIDGGYLPLALAAFLVMIMFTWNYGYRKKYMYELQNKVSKRKLNEIVSDPRIHRVPGLALFYTELLQGISPIFTHYVRNVPALHSVLVFVSIKSLPISKVPLEERFLFRRIEPYELPIFRCVVRYGYMDAREKQEYTFEEMLVDQLKQFIRDDLIMFGLPERRGKMVSESDGSEGTRIDEEEVQREVGLVDDAIKNGGVIYLMGENEVMASKGSSFGKKLVINCGYNWLKGCVRQQDEVFMIPRKRLLKVGMTYEV
ncbi:hypothetical protein L1049_016771 [Liquidambar formosana]|uniref:Potassium transporter n=1 Tax=Liquidambar formosana TaxID=63359 RepID=A0AAP0S6W5_LIQFO